MQEKEKTLKNAGLSTGRNYNSIDGVSNNLPPLFPDEYELDKEKKRHKKKPKKRELDR
jgi:hypothetical protein